MTNQPPRRPTVYVVIVGYNEKHLIEACFQSFRQVDYTPLRIVYVDNASTDGSLPWAKAEFPDVISMSSGGNLGYCGGNNAGIRKALEDGADFVLILNPDTVVCNPAFIGTLVDYMLARPSVGKVGPMVWLRNKGDVQNTILDWPSLFGSASSYVATALGRTPPRKSEAAKEPVRVPSLNGCCLLVRKEAILDVGLYDEGFWCYMDEVDWDWQAERKGWERHYVPVESILHLQKISGYDFTSRANHLMKRNTAIWYAKTGRSVSMFAWMAITMAIALARTITAPFCGRSMKQYASFVGKLATSYRGVCSDWAAGRYREHPRVNLPGAETTS